MQSVNYITESYSLHLTLHLDCLAIQTLFWDLDCQKCNREQEWLPANQIIEHWKGQSYTVYYCLSEIVLGIKILWCLISLTKNIMRTGNSTWSVRLCAHNFYKDEKWKKIPKPNTQPKRHPLVIIFRLLIYEVLQLGKSKEKLLRSELSRQLWVKDRI